MSDRHNGLMEIEPELTAMYFDGWYADMVGSVAKDEIQQRQLGLPPLRGRDPSRSCLWPRRLRS